MTQVEKGRPRLRDLFLAVEERQAAGNFLLIVEVVLSLLAATGLTAQEVGPGSGLQPVVDWSVSRPLPADAVDRSTYPHFYTIFLAGWTSRKGAPSGEVDLTSLDQGSARREGLVFARAVFWSDQDRARNLQVASSTEVDLFFNGRQLWASRSKFRTSAESEAESWGKAMADGLISKTVTVQVRRGLNEIFLMVGGTQSPWTFRVSTDGALDPKPSNHQFTEEAWTTSASFLTPETVLKDPLRDILYVSNFDNEFASKKGLSGFLSRLSLEGDILDLRWVEDLHAPTGMDIRNDTLYVAERTAMAAIDLQTGRVVGRWPIPDPVFPNDLVIDDQGVIYISDTRTGDWAESRIYRFKDGTFDVFANEGISRANGIQILDGALIVGSSGDGFLKRVDLETAEVSKILSLGAAIIDGMQVDEDGHLLVSHWEGQVYLISTEGRLLEILDALPEGWNTADFEYLPRGRLLVIPTFLDNRVRAVRLGLEPLLSGDKDPGFPVPPGRHLGMR